MTTQNDKKKSKHATKTTMHHNTHRREEWMANKHHSMSMKGITLIRKKSLEQSEHERFSHGAHLVVHHGHGHVGDLIMFIDSENELSRDGKR